MARPPALPPRGGKGYTLRMRPQTLQERLMPCTQFEALEQHRQIWRDRGVDSDEETVRDKDEDDDEDDPQEEPAPLEARIRMTTV